MLHRVIYASRSLIGGWSPDLLDIARAALGRNASMSVTGALYFDSQRFFQQLEGEAEAVAAIFDSIAADSRHFDVRVLVHGPTAMRRFAGWSMRFLDGDADRRLHAAFPDMAAMLGTPEAAADRFVDSLESA